MKKYTFPIFITLILFWWSCKSPALAVQKKNDINLYRVSKLDSVENVYLVYLERNDSIFKIFSKKDNCNYSPISIGEYYNFVLSSYFLPEEFHVKMRVAGIKYENVIIKMERDSVVGDLFTTRNLKGLCHCNVP